jgi:hypothetical protein
MNKRIKTITVKNSRGASVAVYTPNFLGEHELVLLEKATNAAEKCNGKVLVTYWS